MAEVGPGVTHGEDVDRPRPSPCCAPAATGPVRARGRREDHPGGGRHEVEQCAVPAGRFGMGDAHGDGWRADGETPVHVVELEGFSVDATTVTNADFAAFVDDSGYLTDAETFGYSAVFHLLLAAPDDDVLGQPPATPWWLGVRGADWRHPEGSRSDLDGRQDHPVVHVSWHDARAYCAWAGRRLPTEAEWEHASRGGLEGARYPWGDDLRADDGAWRCNIWQGDFPTDNSREDGWLSTAPVRTYAPNGYGLWQSVGNVWEWCADEFDPSAYARTLAGTHAGTGSRTSTRDGARSMRGGSYLCHDSYCNRYRNAARSSNTPDSSMGNVGFRTVGR